MPLAPEVPIVSLMTHVGVRLTQCDPMWPYEKWSEQIEYEVFVIGCSYQPNYDMNITMVLY